MTIAVEENRVRKLFKLVEEVEEVANSLPETDDRRRRLLNVSNATLTEEATIRPVIAARLLGLSEKTIRAWADQGVLVVSQRVPRLLLDVMSVHEVSHLIRQLRATGKDRDLLDAVWHRLNDDTLGDRDDFQESLSQMRRGQGRILRPLPEPDTDGR